MIEAMQALLRADKAVFIWGAPGVGKTAMVHAAANAAGAHCETIIGSTIDQTDLARPILAGESVRIAPGPWFEDALTRGRPTWFFLDEYTCAPRSVQAAFLRFVHERAVGRSQMPKTCRVIAAGNPADSAADYHELSAATTNRFAHLHVKLDPDAWAGGELSGWGSGPRVCAPLVCSYLSGVQRGELLHEPGPNTEPGAWPSPRSWSAVIDTLEHIPGADAQARIVSDLGYEIAQSLVGAESAGMLRQWASQQDLPQSIDVLMGKAPIPTPGHRSYVSILGVISLAIERGMQAKLWSVLRTLPHSQMVSAGRVAVKAIESAGCSLDLTEDFDHIIRTLDGLRNSGWKPAPVTQPKSPASANAN